MMSTTNKTNKRLNYSACWQHLMVFSSLKRTKRWVFVLFLKKNNIFLYYNFDHTTQHHRVTQVHVYIIIIIIMIIFKTRTGTTTDLV